MKKYAFFFPVDRDLSLTGGPRTVVNLLTGLQSAGHDVVLLSQRESALTEELRSRGVPVEVVTLPDILDVHDEQAIGYSLPRKAKSLFELLKYNQRVATYCRKHEVDGLWARQIKGILLVGVAAQFLGVPLIWDIGYEKPPSGLMRVLHWIGLGLATRIVTQSKRQFPETFGAQIERLVGYKVDHIYPGISEERQAALRTAARDGAGRSRTVLTIGNIHPRKNQAMTIRALASLLRSTPNLQLAIVGAVRDRDYYDDLLALVDDENLSEAVDFLGWRDDVPALLGRCDLLVLSSLREGIPHVIREAMFAEVPAVATRVGGVPESVQHGETGYLVDPHDPEDLRERVEQLLDDPNLRDEMGENAFELAKERFSKSAWIEAYASVLETT
ncbi:MAG: glycosyltransferase family 4 protein [Candidatus Bipolaricaulia bacterium]